jgi:HSP20 family molecular chaperone IbpA
MKTYSLKQNARIWTRSLLAAGLGLSGLTCIASTPATPDDSASGTPGASTDTTASWEEQFTNRMQHIRKEMDDLFRDSVTDLDSAEKSVFTGPRFDASSSVQDHGDSYVATFNLPKRDLSNVKVNVKDEILSVTASAEQTTRSNSTGKNDSTASETEMLDQYEQIVTLPGPVNPAQMKVDRHGDSIVVTIPKKSEKTASAR